MDSPMTRPAAPLWFWGASALGLLWNAYGVVQFLGAQAATQDSLMAAGMTAEQAAVMLALPVWMTLAFAIGVFGGLAGSAALLARRNWAVPVLAASLAGYIVLYLGDIVKGVFAALGLPQVVILTLVVLIAAGLLGLARFAARRGIFA